MTPQTIDRDVRQDVALVLRKAHGLGALAMSGGTYDAATASVAWPSGEFGPMAIEGAAEPGYRNELAAIADPEERKRNTDRAWLTRRR